MNEWTRDQYGHLMNTDFPFLRIIERGNHIWIETYSGADVMMHDEATLDEAIEFVKQNYPTLFCRRYRYMSKLGLIIFAIYMTAFVLAILDIAKGMD